MLSYTGDAGEDTELIMALTETAEADTHTTESVHFFFLAAK